MFCFFYLLDLIHSDRHVRGYMPACFNDQKIKKLVLSECCQWRGACSKAERGLVEHQVVDIIVENPIKIKALTEEVEVFQALTDEPFFKGGNYENGKRKAASSKKKHSNISCTWARSRIQCCIYTNTSPLTFLSTKDANPCKSVSLH